MFGPLRGRSAMTGDRSCCPPPQTDFMPPMRTAAPSSETASSPTQVWPGPAEAIMLCTLALMMLLRSRLVCVQCQGLPGSREVASRLASPLSESLAQYRVQRGVRLGSVSDSETHPMDAPDECSWSSMLSCAEELQLYTYSYCDS